MKAPSGKINAALMKLDCDEPAVAQKVSESTFAITKTRLF